MHRLLPTIIFRCHLPQVFVPMHRTLRRKPAAVGVGPRYQNVTKMLPKCYKNPSVVLPKCYQDAAGRKHNMHGKTESGILATLNAAGQNATACLSFLSPKVHSIESTIGFELPA